MDTPIIILDERKLSDFFESISSGFQSSLLDILLAVAALAIFIGFLLFMYHLQKKRLREARTRRYYELFERALDKLDLNPSDLDLLDQLAEFLKTPERKYLLLVNQSTFNTCASRIREQGNVPSASLAALRIKLGFTLMNPERIPSSTAELPVGLAVLIISGRDQRLVGRIAAAQTQSLVIGLPDPATLTSGSTVRVYFQNRTGVFSFVTHVQKSVREPKPEVSLAHSEKIQRTQRRQYYRKELSIPVFVRAVGSEDKPQRSMFRDLGGGGASLANPQKAFKAGMDLELTFNPTGADPLSIMAEAIRTSKGGNLIHVRFGSITDSMRDRIIGSLFRTSRTGAKTKS